MKFKLDENLPAEAAKVLGAAGHDVATALQEDLGGRSDQRIAETCRREQRALVTLDTDFGNIQLYPPNDYSGLIVLRLERQDTPRILSVLTRILDAIQDEPLTGRLWVVEETRLRIRPGDDE